MAGLTPLEIQHLDQGGRISARALARALGVISLADMQSLIEKEVKELFEFGGVCICLLDSDGVEVGNEDYFLNEAQCCLISLREDFMKTDVFAFFYARIDEMAGIAANDHDVPPPPPYGRRH